MKRFLVFVVCMFMLCDLGARGASLELVAEIRNLPRADRTAFIPNTTHILWLSGSSLYRHDYSTGQSVLLRQDIETGVSTISASPDGSLAYVASYHTRVLKSSNGDEVSSAVLGTSHIAIHPDGNSIAAADGGILTVLDPVSLDEIRRFVLDSPREYGLPPIPGTDADSYIIYSYNPPSPVRPKQLHEGEALRLINWRTGSIDLLFERPSRSISSIASGDAGVLVSQSSLVSTQPIEIFLTCGFVGDYSWTIKDIVADRLLRSGGGHSLMGLGQCPEGGEISYIDPNAWMLSPKGSFALERNALINLMTGETFELSGSRDRSTSFSSDESLALIGNSLYRIRTEPRFADAFVVF